MDSSKTHTAREILEELMARYPQLNTCRDSIVQAHECLRQAFSAGNKLLIAGNGGSAADSDHITGELTKSFRFKRMVDPALSVALRTHFGDEGDHLSKNLEGGLPVIPLPQFAGANSAYANDTEPKAAFAQLVNALGKEGDVFLGISTSGNSANIVYSLMVAKAKGVRSIALTGASGGRCREIADICIAVPEKETFKVQELHLPVYHALCSMVEADLFDGVERR